MKDTARKLAYLNTENKQKEEKTFPENLNHKPVHADMQSDSYHQRGPKTLKQISINSKSM